MTETIEEFASVDKPPSYYEKLNRDINELNNRLHAFNLLSKIDRGVPFSVKDNICVNGVESTAGSPILKGYIPPFDATVVEKIKQASFSFIGKTSMDEFGFGTFGINCDTPAKNPFDEERVAGGSSSGAAVATAILKHHIAIAESTGGSISAPAAFCGVVGFTPTYGAVSRYGLIDYANSLDKIGVMARNSSDLRYAFDIIRGTDDYDSTCTNRAIENFSTNKLTVIKELVENVDSEILEPFNSLLDTLKGQGYSVEYKSLEILKQSIPAYYIISMAEASTNLAKYTGFKYGHKNMEFTENYNLFFTNSRTAFGTEAKRRVILGTFVRSASVKNRYYFKALNIRNTIIAALKETLKDSLIISPTMPVFTPKFSEVKELTPVQNYSMDAITIPPNLSGLPHMSFPYTYLNGMPVGAQIVTDHFNDYALISFLEAWEKSFKPKFKYNIGAI